MTNEQRMADEILKHIGGSDNVKNLTHCMTRLRFVLKDDSKADDDAIKILMVLWGYVSKVDNIKLL